MLRVFADTLPLREARMMNLAPCSVSHLAKEIASPPDPPVMRYVASEDIEDIAVLRGMILQDQRGTHVWNKGSDLP